MLFLKQASAVTAVMFLCMQFSAAQDTCAETLPLLVTDNNGVPVIAAGVSCAATSTIADENGYASLSGLCRGTIHLHVQAEGFVQYDSDLQVPVSDTIKVRLQRDKLTLDAVEVQGHRQRVATANSVTTLDERTLDRLKGGNLATMLSSVPGVTNLQTGATIGKPVVNGMHSNRLLILNNGIRQEGQQWGSEHAPEIDPFIAQSITVIKGAEAVRYGAEAIGGVVLVEPGPLPADSALHAEVNLVAASNGRGGTASAMLSGNLKKMPALAWRVQGTARKSGNYRTADYFLDNTGVRELNYSAALAYTKKHFDADIFYSHFNNETGIFNGSHIGSQEDLVARIENGKPFSNGSFYYDIDAPRQLIKHDLVKATAHLHLNDYLHLNAQYGFQKDQRQEFDRRRGGLTATPALAYDLYTHTLDLNLEYFNGNDVKVVAGLNSLYQQNRKEDGTFTRPLIPNFNTQGQGVYVTAKKMKANYDLEAGLRYDYKYLTAAGYRNNEYYGGRFHFNNITGSLGGNWHGVRGFTVSSNIGTAWRPPTVNELYSDGLHHGAGAVEYGDSSLRSERSIKWITTVDYTRQSWLRLNMDVYANYFDGYIYLNPTGEISETQRGAFPVFRTRQDNARFLGADLTADFRLSQHLNYNIKGSVIRARNTSLDTYLPMIPADRLEQSIRLEYDLGNHFKNCYLQATNLLVAKQSRYIDGSDFAPPPPGYSLFHVSAGGLVKQGEHELSINFEVNNVANTLYKDYMNRFRYYAHDIGRNFIVRLTYRI